VILSELNIFNLHANKSLLFFQKKDIRKTKRVSKSLIKTALGKLNVYRIAISNFKRFKNY